MNEVRAVSADLRRGRGAVRLRRPRGSGRTRASWAPRRRQADPGRHQVGPVRALLGEVLARRRRGLMAFTLPRRCGWPENGFEDLLLAYPTADGASGSACTRPPPRGPDPQGRQCRAPRPHHEVGDGPPFARLPRRRRELVGLGGRADRRRALADPHARAGGAPWPREIERRPQRRTGGDDGLRGADRRASATARREACAAPRSGHAAPLRGRAGRAARRDRRRDPRVRRAADRQRRRHRQPRADRRPRASSPRSPPARASTRRPSSTTTRASALAPPPASRCRSCASRRPASRPRSAAATSPRARPTRCASRSLAAARPAPRHEEGAGEVQTPLLGAAADALRVGDRVYLRHAKAGELCERFDDPPPGRGRGDRRRRPDLPRRGQAFL